jgi:hypothetical protein
VLGWRADPQAPLAPITAPLEELVETEGFGADLATRVELGGLFEALLAARPIPPAARTAILKAFRTAHPLTSAGVSPADARARRFIRVCQGRTLDGAALAAAHAGGAALPADPDVAANAVEVRLALDDLVREIGATLGKVGAAEAPACLPPSAGAGTIQGEVLEEVRFARDEQANTAWGIEHATEGGDGRPGWGTSGAWRSRPTSRLRPNLAGPWPGWARDRAGSGTTAPSSRTRGRRSRDPGRSPHPSTSTVHDLGP